MPASFKDAEIRALLQGPPDLLLFKSRAALWSAADRTFAEKCIRELPPSGNREYFHRWLREVQTDSAGSAPLEKAGARGQLDALAGDSGGGVWFKIVFATGLILVAIFLLRWFGTDG